jgi:hypothetical protein
MSARVRNIKHNKKINNLSKTIKETKLMCIRKIKTKERSIFMPAMDRFY